MTNKNQGSKHKPPKKQHADSQALVPIKVVNGRKVPDTSGTRQVTKAQKAEIATLAKADATPAEIAMLMGLRESQVERQLKQLHDRQCAETVSVSVQTRQNSSSIDARLMEKSNRTSYDIVQRIAELIPDETDISKLATCLKVLHGIAQSAEVKTEVTTITSRLRSM